MKQNFVLALLFFISGFCGLLYQLIWIRLAFSQFGIITPVLSIVISVFMFGLALGSWWGGKNISALSKKTGLSPAIFYAGAEALIGLSAFLVPYFFSLGADSLLKSGAADTVQYLLTSALIIGLTLFPWVFAMGTTFPFMMAFIKKHGEDANSFSFLYQANVVGAMSGVIFTAFILIESLGFQNTLVLGGTLNFLVAAMSLFLSRHTSTNPNRASLPKPDLPQTVIPKSFEDRPIHIPSILFISGFSSMAFEVIWTRAFTPVMATTIYAFASLLVAYLFATWIGTSLYRLQVRKKQYITLEKLLGPLAIFSLLPLLLNDPAMEPGKISVLFSIMPFCGILGYLTPKLIDEYSLGNPGRAGYAYAVNILGCILGPLVAGYFLLPWWGVKISVLVLTLPFLLFLFSGLLKKEGVIQRTSFVFLTTALFLVTAKFINTFETPEVYGVAEVRRDHTATVISTGNGMNKRLLVNGVGITVMTPITKLMAHLPLSFHPAPKESLIICFGMGTTFRSLASWGIEATAVELVPSVVDAFGYYFKDAEEVMNRSNTHVIIDDGRRFLKRTNQKYDVITIDPPPPLETAGSSLLYSSGFYKLLKKRLNKEGLVLQWFPGGDLEIFRAIANTILENFPYVKAYTSFPSLNNYGVFFVSSMTPLHPPSVNEFFKRMPEKAKEDYFEWYPEIMENLGRFILAREVNLGSLTAGKKDWVISDDQPVNEYFMLRKLYKDLKGAVTQSTALADQGPL